MPDTQSAEAPQINTAWGFGLKGLTAPLGPTETLTITRRAREADAVFDVHSYDGLEGTHLTFELPDGTRSRMRIEAVAVNDADDAVTLTLRGADPA